MAILQKQLVHDNTTLSAYLEWAQGLSGFFTSAGFTRTADTGQVNWGSVVSVPSANTYRDWEIFKSNDTLSSQLPIILKCAYGTTTSWTEPQFQITVGTGTDGAGNVTQAWGPVSPRNFGYTSSYNLGTSSRFECNGSWVGTQGSGIALMMYRNASNGDVGPWFLGVERSKDANGNDTAEYFTVAMFGYNGTPNSKYQCYVGSFFPNGTTTPTMNCIPCLIPDIASTVFAGQVYVSPMFPLVGKIGNPLTMLVIGKYGDWPESSIVSGQLYGTTHNWLMTRNGSTLNMGGNTSSYQNGGGTTNNNCWGIRWDVNT